MAQKMTLDFSQVRDGGGFSPKHKPEGEYLGTVVSFEDTKSKSGNAMWVFGIALKNDRRAIYPVYCLLGPEHLWKLRQVMMGAGIQVPKKKLSVDGNRLVGKDLGICLEDDEYEGKKKSVISAFFPASEYEGDDTEDSDEDEEPVEDEDIEDEVQDDSDEEDMDEDDEESDDTDDEAGEVDEEEDEEPEPAPKKVAKKAPARAKAKRPEPADEDDDEMDVEDL